MIDGGRPEAIEAARGDSSGGAVLEIRRLSIHFETREGPLRALRDVSLAIAPGETLGLAGESGSGKSTLGYAVMGALAPEARVTSGQILLEGGDLLTAPPGALRRLRGRRMAMVYQDPRSALNPTMTVGRQIAEVLEIHQLLPGAAAQARAGELLELVGIADPLALARRYPHQLSGGMQQRVVIAMALAGNPSLLIMDEPTTGLDVTTQARILDLVAELKERVRAAILYISHDLAVVAQVSDRVGILYAGELVETAPAGRLFGRPAHPYTAGLLDARPDLDGVHGLRPIEGRIPPLTRLPPGCTFAPRCGLAEPECTRGAIALAPVASDHLARCRRWPVVVATPPHREALDWRQARARAGAAVVVVENAIRHYGDPGLMARKLSLGAPPVRAVDGVSFDARRDEVLALVGESGCGKSTLGRLLVRLLPLTAGRIRFYDRNGLEVPEGPRFRRLAQIVFQHPDSSLNPMRGIGASLARPLALLGTPRPARRRRVAELLEAVRLGPDFAGRRPHELSGGEKQRVAIARAMAMDPEFVVLDEPVSALDVSTQASLMRLLMELRRESGASYVLISHDLSLVRHVADRVAVMYLGRLVEMGRVGEIFAPPSHPYTRALLSAVPRLEPDAARDAIRLEGAVPSAQRPPPGCRFHTRCPQKIGRVCEEVEPPIRRPSETHWIACHIPLSQLSAPEPPRGAGKGSGRASSDPAGGSSGRRPP